MAPPDPLRSRDDATLAGLAAVGDRGALEVLLDRHLDRVHAICRRVLTNPEDALDASQEALIAIARGIERFDGRAAFTTWLHRIATNAAIDELRRRQRRPTPDAAMFEDSGPGSPGPVASGPGPEGIGDRIDIDAALARIPEEFRVAVVLRDLCDLDYAQIADVLEIPPGTVRSRIARPRRVGERAGAILREPAWPERSSNGRPTMTQPPPLPPSSSSSPLPFGDATDEALSALVDGELGAFAADHGITEDEARSRLEQWPEYPTRIAALEQGRAALAAPVPALDDVSRRRLIRNALPPTRDAEETPKRTGWSWQRISAAAAAAIIVLAGLGAMLTVLGTGEGTDNSATSGAGGSSTAADAESSTEAVRGDLGNLGNVTDPASIRDLLEPGAEERSPARSEPDDLDTQEGFSSDSGRNATKDSDGTALAPPAAAGSIGSDAAVATPEACAAKLAGTRPVRFFATGTYQGQPVTIVGVDSGDRTIAFVVPRGDCTNVLTSVSR